MSKEKFGGNERAEEQNEDRLKGGYGGDYFDENQHRAGQEKRDLATGEPYVNDQDVKDPGAEEFNERIILNNDKKIKKEFDDDTEEWLKKNDPDYLGLGEYRKK